MSASCDDESSNMRMSTVSCKPTVLRREANICLRGRNWGRFDGVKPVDEMLKMKLDWSGFITLHWVLVSSLCPRERERRTCSFWVGKWMVGLPESLNGTSCTTQSADVSESCHVI